MATDYKHGAYALRGATIAPNAAQSGTIACYIGTAPVHLLRNADECVNTPIAVANYGQAVSALGYSDNWESYTLCEAMRVHLNNPLGSIAPIYLINVLDPAKHRKTGQKTESVTFRGGVARFKSDTIILDTLAIANKAEGVDYSVSYDFSAGEVVLKSASLENASVTFNEVDASKVTAADIIGTTNDGDGIYSGIGALPLIWIRDGKFATLLAAPGWSHVPSVRNALVTAAQGVNGHWRSYSFTDIPLDSVTTIAAAKQWKSDNAYNSDRETPCWPMGIDNEGRVYHLSTMSVWAQQSTNAAHDGVPFETASNKQVPLIRQYFGKDVTRAGYDKETANALNEVGIRTLVPDRGKMVLWGGHTGAYTFGNTTDAAQIFDTNTMMTNHIINSFQLEWGDRTDKPMTLQLKDEILNREQDKLDGYVAMGALIGSPVVEFIPSENKTLDIMNGDFRFTHLITPTPQMKSVTATVSYTADGFSVYTQE